jgi:hypothetical protein
MSEMMKGLQKFFTKEMMIILVIFGVLIFFMMSYSEDKYSFSDSMAVSSSVQKGNVDMSSQSVNVVPPVAVIAPTDNVPMGGYSAQSVANPSDLLPSDQNSAWASLNPVNQGNPMIPDLLQAGYHIGLDTVGQTLKNPNLQLRSDPYIPKAAVGPWNQSTYEPDLMRVPLEVGVGPQ